MTINVSLIGNIDHFAIVCEINTRSNGCFVIVQSIKKYFLDKVGFLKYFQKRRIMFSVFSFLNLSFHCKTDNLASKAFYFFFLLKFS